MLRKEENSSLFSLFWAIKLLFSIPFYTWLLSIREKVGFDCHTHFLGKSDNWPAKASVQPEDMPTWPASCSESQESPSSIIHNSQKLEAAQVSIDRWTDKQSVVYTKVCPEGIQPCDMKNGDIY